MSYHIEVIGRDKEKLKEVIRAEQVKDPVGNPHSGVPAWVADRLCSEIDRVRIYQFTGKSYGLRVKASGSFHEQGSNDSSEIGAVLMSE